MTSALLLNKVIHRGNQNQFPFGAIKNLQCRRLRHEECELHAFIHNEVLLPVAQFHPRDFQFFLRARIVFSLHSETMRLQFPYQCFDLDAWEVPLTNKCQIEVLTAPMGDMQG